MLNLYWLQAKWLEVSHGTTEIPVCYWAGLAICDIIQRLRFVSLISYFYSSVLFYTQSSFVYILLTFNFESLYSLSNHYFLLISSLYHIAFSGKATMQTYIPIDSSSIFYNLIFQFKYLNTLTLISKCRTNSLNSRFFAIHCFLFNRCTFGTVFPLVHKMICQIVIGWGLR